MCKYHFDALSINGLHEAIYIMADNWSEALAAVKKHIHRQQYKELDILTKVEIICSDCGDIFRGYEHVDLFENKDMTFDELVECALCKDSRYREFKKLHSYHDSWTLIPDGK